MTTTSKQLDRLIVNDRIHLSEILSSDVPAFVKHLNQDKDIYERTFRVPYPYKEEDANWFVNLQQERSVNGHPQTLAIRLTDTLELIGCVGFTDVWQNSAELGYWLAKPHWGQGIMTKVVQAMCQHYATKTDCRWQSIIAKVFDTNAASARVLEKNGFVFKELLPRHLKKDDKWRDAKVYKLEL
ncbi:acetyltransferase, (GNAT) family [Seminavis robusta]|uniref:Acetyltransferase, (GNAT) family n=1 Tax=Seminavis robusta TaxID=568900 RepID=A0A9N8DBI0_9STRA|nr:acetyltransferase, (GNAT) family [Seminavis robusta]|eukprot:Sro72_g040110.1 acetyltransferase, (GNAT) family (184) ;mRNA; r:124433-124984